MMNGYFILGEAPLNGLHGLYDWVAVAFSFIIAMLATYVSLDMAVQLHRETLSNLRRVWRWGGAVVFGCGIWAMHFTGMLAYNVEIEHRYTWPMTVMAFAIALAVAAVVFDIIARPRMTRRAIFLTAPLLGLGLAVMLYTGMGAVETRGTLHYTAGWVANSLVLAIAAGGVTLWLALLAQQQTRLPTRRFMIASAALLAFLLCAMQFSANQASVIVPFMDARLGPEFDDVNSLLASSVGVVTLMILGIALTALFLSQRMTQHLKLEVTKRTEELQRSAEDLRVAKEQAEEANLAKSEFLANMSHEIRTPINAVVGIANILNADMLQPEKRKEYLNTLQLSAESLLNLINELLDISKIETNKVELEEAPFDMAELIDEVIRIISVRGVEKGLRISLDYTADCPRLFIGDSLRVRQILVNILSNAVKFTEEGGIDIHVHSSPGKQNKTDLRIRVTDTGIGIPTSKLTHIFDKFIQADTSHSRKYGGTGLGLSISRGLAQRMDGNITVASKEGKGSEFTIQLLLPAANGQTMPNPRTRPSISAAPEQDNQEPEPQARILLVEDNAANILVAKSYLDIFGFEYAIAHNGAEAVEKHTRHPFDLILMDVQMPVMDGYEATRRIREWEEQGKHPHTPIIAMTSHGRVEDRERCLRQGMDEYIPKPFRPDDLKSKILALLQIKVDAA